MEISSRDETLAKAILEHVGGTDNIRSLTHCMTRLRFIIKDDSKVSLEELKKLDGVLSALYSSGQYMVIIGNRARDVYNAVCSVGKIGGSASPSAENAPPSEAAPALHEHHTLFSRFISMVTDIFAPYISVIAALGLLKGILILLSTFGLLSENGSTYQILYALSDGFFYYMPILLAYTASIKFGLPAVEGLVIGAGIVYPTLLKASTAAHGTLFGLPLIMPPSGDYTVSVIPVLCAVAFAAWLEKRIKDHIPEIVRPYAVPLITCTATFSLTLLIIGPIATELTNLLSLGLNWMAGLNGVLYSAIVGGTWEIALIASLQYAVLPIVMSNLTNFGKDPTLAAIYGCNFAQVGAILAIRLRTKNDKTRRMCAPTLLPALVGIIEPALFGMTLPRKKVFLITCLCSGAVGIGMSLSKVVAYRIIGFGIVGYATFSNATQKSGMLWAIIWSLAGMALSFALVFFTCRQKDIDG
jgi:PTS system beta-glucosides-specific IIC component